MRIQNSQLVAAKVSKLEFRETRENSPDISMGFFNLGMCEFDPSQVSQAVWPSEKRFLIVAERPATAGLLRIGHQSLPSNFGRSLSQLADSLRLTFEKLPFSGDRGRRLGSIDTAWPAWQSYLVPPSKGRNREFAIV